MLNKRILVSAGGTGGHILPALHVSKELVRSGAEVFYIGNKNSMEYDIITRNNIAFYPIDVQKLYRSFTFKHFLFPFKLIKSIFQCLKYIKEIKPDAFIGFGGFVSGPPAVAAWLSKCPVFLQEQNCKPGITNIWTGKFSKGIFLAHEDSIKYFNKKKAYITGNPVSITNFEKKSGLPQITTLSPDNKKLFILGGSQGSLFINNLILAHLDWFSENKIDLIWQTGKNHLDKIRKEIGNRPNIYTFDFTDSINDFYAMADYIITRGGALSLAEIEIFKIPAFIIPLSTAAVNEQYHNALSMERENKGICFIEKDKEYFLDRFKEFLDKSQQMYLNDTTSIHLQATKKITTLLKEKL